MKVFRNFFVTLILVIFISLLIFNFLNIDFGKNAQGDNITPDNLTIIIDPGHGGVDGGAVAPDGTNEKDINLDIAHKLNEILILYGFNTIMTRTEDCSIHDSSAKSIREKKVSDIHNRMKLIDKTNNCIFVSLHQNSYGDSEYWGTQVFYSPNTVQSRRIADSIQSSVKSLLQPNNNRQIKECTKSVYLIYYAKKPAILVECGFMTNPDDLKLLKNEEYQLKMAFCVADGILNYINKGS